MKLKVKNKSKEKMRTSIFPSLPFDSILDVRQKPVRRRVERKIALISSGCVKGTLEGLEAATRARAIEEIKLKQENEQQKTEIKRLRDENVKLKAEIDRLDKKVQDVISGIQQSHDQNNLEENISELRYLVKNLLSAPAAEEAKKIAQQTELAAALNRFYERKVDVLIELQKSAATGMDSELRGTLEKLDLDVSCDSAVSRKVSGIVGKMALLADRMGGAELSNRLDSISSEPARLAPGNTDAETGTIAPAKELPRDIVSVPIQAAKEDKTATSPDEFESKSEKEGATIPFNP